MSAESYRRCEDCRWRRVTEYPECRAFDAVTLGSARTLCRGERWEAPPPASIA